MELPDWAGSDPARLELIREEIERHAGACVEFYTRATHVQVKCSLAKLSIVEEGFLTIRKA